MERNFFPGVSMTDNKNLSPFERSKEAITVTNISIGSGIFLTVFKFFAGVLGNSTALIADAVHSLSDLLSDVVLVIAFRIVRKPYDEDHNYGHGKFETLSTVFIGVVLLLAAGTIAFENFGRLKLFWLGQDQSPPTSIALWGAGLSIAIKEFLFFITMKKAKKLNSGGLKANAWHHHTDALSSIATLIGVGGAIFLGGRWWVLDPVAAMIVSVFVAVVGVRIFKEAIDVLTEKSLGEESHLKILQLANKVKGIVDPHDIRSRKIGNEVAIDFHVRIDSEMSVKEAHDLVKILEHLLYDEFGVDSLLTIHVDPLQQHNK